MPCVAYMQGKAPAPTPADWEQVAGLRLHAKGLFGAIILSVSHAISGSGPGTAQPLN